MDRRFDTIAAALVLLLHLAWIIFVMGGALITRGRPRLAVLHLSSLFWGIAVELGPWPCPLTLAENAFEARAGTAGYSGGFLVHYLDRIVYPNLSVELLTICGVSVCVLNLALYGYRLWCWSKRRSMTGAA